MLLCFAGVLLVGAPYLPTLSPQVTAALELAKLSPGQTLLELGCGDGKVVLAAAKQGYRIVGYELNPILALIAWVRTRRYKDLVTIKCANFWKGRLPPADAIFVFLLPKFMTALNNKVMQDYNTPVKVVSFAFTIPGRDATQVLDGVYLYTYA